MLVKLWMSGPPITVGPSAPVGEAAAVMARRHVRRLLVVDPADEKGRLLGIVSLLDVARAFPADLNPLSASAIDAPPVPVREIMASNVVTVSPTMPIAVAARLLREKKVGALPVTLGGAPVGIITESDVFRAMVEMSGIRRDGTSVTLRVPPGETPMAIAKAAEKAGLQIENFFTAESEGVRTMTMRARGRISADVVESLYAHGWPILGVHPEAAP